MRPWLEAHTVFEAVCRGCVTDTQDWIEMNNDIQKAHSVLRGWQTIDRDEPLFRVALVKLTKQPKSKSFVLLISMSHLLGDGHTYYSLYATPSLPFPTHPVAPDRTTRLRPCPAPCRGSTGLAG